MNTIKYEEINNVVPCIHCEKLPKLVTNIGDDLSIRSQEIRCLTVDESCIFDSFVTIRNDVENVSTVEKAINVWNEANRKIKVGFYETKMHKAQEILDKLTEIEHTKWFKFVSDMDEAEYIVSYGGDGTLLDAYQKFPDKIIVPIRDYDQCDIHKSFYNYLNSKHIEKRDVLKCNVNEEERFGISEVVFRNDNISQAIRFDLYINNKPYALNSIGDGLIVSTALGSTGYFKNITNTFFANGIGIGFLNSAQRMAHLIIPSDSLIKIEIKRGNIEMTVDHQESYLIGNQIIEIKVDQTKELKLLGYTNEFMCSKCRDKRHSSYVNSIYNVI